MQKILLFLSVFFHLTTAPKPLTFTEMDKLYGPCVRVPVLMYHHIQDGEIARKLGQSSLTVNPEYFAKQMEYLKTKGYTTISLSAISNFFDHQTPLPEKPIAITFDDAYEDNYTNAYPILKQFEIKATIFTPTGLVTVPDYLTWTEIKEMADSGLVEFGNHTWSHRNAQASIDILDKEISLADEQLAEKGLNTSNVFAYPYGTPSDGAEKVLAKYNYKLAFTTSYGSLLCAKKRFELPRIRVGNAALGSYGL